MFFVRFNLFLVGLFDFGFGRARSASFLSSGCFASSDSNNRFARSLNDIYRTLFFFGARFSEP